MARFQQKWGMGRIDKSRSDDDLIMQHSTSEYLLALFKT